MRDLRVLQGHVLPGEGELRIASLVRVLIRILHCIVEGLAAAGGELQGRDDLGLCDFLVLCLLAVRAVVHNGAVGDLHKAVVIGLGLDLFLFGLCVGVRLGNIVPAHSVGSGPPGSRVGSGRGRGALLRTCCRGCCLGSIRSRGRVFCLSLFALLRSFLHRLYGLCKPGSVLAVRQVQGQGGLLAGLEPEPVEDPVLVRVFRTDHAVKFDLSTALIRDDTDSFIIKFIQIREVRALSFCCQDNDLLPTVLCVLRVDKRCQLVTAPGRQLLRGKRRIVPGRGHSGQDQRVGHAEHGHCRKACDRSLPAFVPHLPSQEFEDTTQQVLVHLFHPFIPYLLHQLPLLLHCSSLKPGRRSSPDSAGICGSFPVLI